MVQEFVYGIYASLNEAEAVVEELIGKGVSRSGIKLLASEDVVNHAQTTTSIESIDDLTEKTSHWWEGILGFLTFDSQDKDRSDAERKIDISGYKDNIDAGEVLVVVDGAFENAAYPVNLAATTSDMTPDTGDHLLDDSQNEQNKAVFIESSDVTVFDSSESELPIVEDTAEDTDELMPDVATSLPEASSEDSIESSTETSLPEHSEPIDTTNLPNNLYNPLSGASMADEPGVNIEEFENLTEKEVEQLDRVDNMDNLDQPETATADSPVASEFESEVVEVTEENSHLDETTKPYGDPTIHQEEVERQPRSLDDLRHPRENITPADVQRTIDEIRDPK